MGEIKVSSITKDYKDKRRALDDVNLCIKENKIYGLLGRNGAGKTTLLNIINDKIFPTAGKITVDGEDLIENEKILNSIAYMMQDVMYPLNMEVRELFEWAEKFYIKFDQAYANRLAKKFKLDVTKELIELSTGYSTIFKDILTLATNARILIFDEPVLGLDANHRNMFYKELLKSYNEKPKTIIISTHLIDEVADVIEEVIIIKKGKIIREESVDRFLSSAYIVSGRTNNVDKYLENRDFVVEETMETLKIATVLESTAKKSMGLKEELKLEFSKVELQKLFITLTNS
ncbi:MAG: multidrug ABC transporter ATP-binding protein [Alkaliphilus sp.]|nr:ABC transporter ATP-binding protein [bacterium AH-315-L21]MBN4069330.1 ABC transporter ATP-binding protein [bacterium AH-315-G05]PHS35926.1 MAG: multidrug ABC transporter ATP-binding protein [Alkaliphilus sp.]